VAPTAFAEGQSLSKKMRTAYRDLHDTATQSKFNQLVLRGGITPVQYQLFLIQRLATFEALERKLYQVDGLPDDLRGFYTGSEHAIVLALRKDLGHRPDQSLAKDALPDGTLRLVEKIEAMNPYEAASIASIMIGGSAFGAHMLADKIEGRLDTKDVRGLRAYKMDPYVAMVARLNRVQSASRHQEMIAAGRWFFRTQTAMSNGPEFD
jgi:hypothetical protein